MNLKHGFDFNYRLEALDKLDCPDSACAELSDGYQKDPSLFPHEARSKKNLKEPLSPQKTQGPLLAKN